jgi:hypothetical protein
LRNLLRIASLVAITWAGCTTRNSKQNNVDSLGTNAPHQSSENAINTTLPDNIKKSHPYSKIKLSSYKPDPATYNNIVRVDTSDCSSFKFQRVFIGDISQLFVLVRSYSPDKYILQNGELNLWPCTLPVNVKSGDTLIVTGSVFDAFGNEKVPGFPTILTEVKTRGSF